MNYKVKEVYDVDVLQIKGKLEGGPGAAEFQDFIASKINSGRTKFVANLGDVKFVNSTGIGILIRAFTSLKNAGGDLKLAEVSEKVNGVLSITKLNSVFKFYDTENDAVRSYEE